MNSRQALIAAILCCPSVCGSQELDVIPLKSEPHHHLALHNEYVNVYSVQVSPHDSVRLHKHDADAISIVMSDSEITVRAPGKPDSHQRVVNGQLRLQSAGYVHSTSIDGDTPYRNITVELLAAQKSRRNLCATVIADQPMNCPEPSDHSDGRGRSEQPQFQTDETNVTLIRILPRQSTALQAPGVPQLLVVLDDVSTASNGSSPGRILGTGDFLWRDPNGAPEIFTNHGAKEVRLVAFAFQRQESAK